VHRLSRGLSAA